MIRYECCRCKKLAYTGEIKIEDDHQVFICWRCREKAELERERKLKELSEENEFPDRPPSETEEILWNKYQQDKKQKELIEEYERIRKMPPSPDLYFGPNRFGPNPFIPNPLVPYCVTNEEYKAYPSSGK